MRAAITCIFLCLFPSLFGQSVFESGYIVKINNDTIKGSIKHDIEEKLSTQISFQSSNGVIETHIPATIKAFGFTGGDQFRIVVYTDPTDNFISKNHFAKLLFDGINELYSFIRKDIHFFVAKIKEDTTFLMYDLIQNAIGQMIEQGNYQNQLFFIGRECDALRARAAKTNYNEPDMIKYFVALDKCLGNSNAEAVHYVKPKTITQVYVFAGGLPLGDKYQVMAQGMIKFIIPSQSRKTSLNIGIAYLKNKRTAEDSDYFGTVTEFDLVTDIIEIPLLIQYDLLEGKVRPFVYGGPGVGYKRESAFTEPKSNDSGVGVTLIGGAGIEGYVAKKVFLKIDWRYDLLAHYPVVGIGIRLK
jgi:hypothetical protein